MVEEVSQPTVQAKEAVSSWEKTEWSGVYDGMDLAHYCYDTGENKINRDILDELTKIQKMGLRQRLFLDEGGRMSIVLDRLDRLPLTDASSQSVEELFGSKAIAKIAAKEQKEEKEITARIIKIAQARAYVRNGDIPENIHTTELGKDNVRRDFYNNGFRNGWNTTRDATKSRRDESPWYLT
ncbi:hypothetical protein IPM62_02860 [Candidatus Woesebacteria bacterium]|nr:MAG: hypothetical protein IPM62_02860 [Candidatus Woesebacteria bacterium]